MVINVVSIWIDVIIVCYAIVCYAMQLYGMACYVAMIDGHLFYLFVYFV